MSVQVWSNKAEHSIIKDPIENNLEKYQECF